MAEVTQSAARTGRKVMKVARRNMKLAMAVSESAISSVDPLKKITSVGSLRTGSASANIAQAQPIRICMPRKRFFQCCRLSAVISCFAARLAKSREKAWKLSAISDQMIRLISRVI
ncbi:hypothetical protein D3C80_1271290 [compost metagenome]